MMRIGHGYDAHRFGGDRPLVIGGVKIEYDRGLLAHSDGDVLVHALMDALLGAAGEKDIGNQFPDSDDEYLGADSCLLLERVCRILDKKGLSVEYADMTVIAQRPKLAPYLDMMKEKLASVMNTGKDRVNVKATTEEKMGFTGRGEGISAHAVVLLRENG